MDAPCSVVQSWSATCSSAGCLTTWKQPCSLAASSTVSRHRRSQLCHRHPSRISPPAIMMPLSNALSTAHTVHRATWQRMPAAARPACSPHGSSSQANQRPRSGRHLRLAALRCRAHWQMRALTMLSSPSTGCADALDVAARLHRTPPRRKSYLSIRQKACNVAHSPARCRQAGKVLHAGRIQLMDSRGFWDSARARSCEAGGTSCRGCRTAGGRAAGRQDEADAGRLSGRQEYNRASSRRQRKCMLAQPAVSLMAACSWHGPSTAAQHHRRRLLKRLRYATYVWRSEGGDCQYAQA